MNQFQRDTRNYVKAAAEQVGAILSSIENAGIAESGMRDAYDLVNAAAVQLDTAAATILTARNEGGEA